MWRTIEAALAKWGLVPLPPTADKLLALGAALKAGAYSAAENYLGHYRVRAERAGHVFPPDLQRLLHDITRSCKRGRGGPIKALGLPLLRLGDLRLDDDGPWLEGGPIGPGCAMVAGAWFLTREVELSTTRAALVTLEEDYKGSKIVRWSLPASKTDQEARGVARTHGCNCVGQPTASCPYHAVDFQLRRLKRVFPARWRDGTPDIDLPLFPSVDGHTVTKDKMTATIVQAALRLDIPTSSSDGAARVSGHSLRASGAQGLARAGVDTWAIQLLGRWGSDTVLEYIREVPLELSASWATRATSSHSTDLASLLASRSAAASSTVVSPPPSCLSRPGEDREPLRVQASQPASLPAPALAVEAGPRDLDQALLEAEHAATVEALPLTDCSFLSSSSGKWHKLSHTGLIGSSAGWSAACGWRFAGSSAALRNSLPENLCHKHFCAKCFPEHRACLKAEAG